MSDNEKLEIALAELQGTASNFARTMIQDSWVRHTYLTEIEAQTSSYRHLVAAGQMTAQQAAEEAYQVRNIIMEASRLRLSQIGAANSVRIKSSPPPLAAILDKNASKIYGRPFIALETQYQNKVYLEVIESSARGNTSVNASARSMSVLGRSLVVLSVGIAVYNVTTADNKAQAFAREGAIAGGGILGGAAGGAAAGLMCGPGAPVCSTVGVFVGGALGAFGVHLAFSKSNAG